MLPSLAQLPPLPTIKPVTPGGETVPSVLATIIGWFLLVAGALGVIYLIWAGYQYITSAGDPEKATKARNSILYTAIGIVVIVLSYVIVQTVAKEAGTITKPKSTTSPPATTTPPPTGGGGRELPKPQ